MIAFGGWLLLVILVLGLITYVHELHEKDDEQERKIQALRKALIDKIELDLLTFSTVPHRYDDQGGCFAEGHAGDLPCGTIYVEDAFKLRDQVSDELSDLINKVLKTHLESDHRLRNGG